MVEVCLEESLQFIPRNHILWLALTNRLSESTIIEVAMRGSWNDEQLLVLRHGIGLADKIIPFSLALHHVVIGSLAKVA